MEKTVEEATESDKEERNAITPSWVWIRSQSSAYPIRPGEEDCHFYLKRRMCGFGSQCRYNHPPLEKIPERIHKQRDCKFFLVGACKRGSACKFNHPKELNNFTSKRASESGIESEDICQNLGDIEGKFKKTMEMSENHNVEAHDEGNADEQRKIEIEKRRREERSRLDRMRPTAVFDESSRPRELMEEFGLEDFVGI